MRPANVLSNCVKVQDMAAIGKRRKLKMAYHHGQVAAVGLYLHTVIVGAINCCQIIKCLRSAS